MKPILQFDALFRLHTAVDQKVREDVFALHSIGNFVRKSFSGFNLTYAVGVHPIDDPREGEFCIGLHSENAWPIDDQALEPEQMRGRSCRKFSAASVDWAVFEKLFVSAFAEAGGRRPYPSAGAMYPVQVLACILKPLGNAPREVQANVFHFLPSSRRFMPIETVPAARLLSTLFDAPHEYSAQGNEPITDPVFFILYALHLDSAVVRYRHRGYRFALVEVGAMAQQAAIVGRGLGLGSCIYGGFGDAELSVVMGINPTVLLPAIAQCFGKPPLPEG
jgi:SagB-type dehydrogenase family enzyme